MIPKKHRFTTAQFERSFKKSFRVFCGNFLFLVSENRFGNKIGVVVGKKVSKSAVKRNRIRRQLYEMIRTDLFPKISGKNVICLYQGDDVLTDRNTFFEACNVLIKKLKNFRKQK